MLTDEFQLPEKEHLELLRRLSVRAGRLSKLARLKAPTSIIAMETLLVVKSAMVICGRSLADQFMTWIAGHLREGDGLCRFCGRAKAFEAPMCSICMAEMEQEDRDLLLMESENGSHN